MKHFKKIFSAIFFLLFSVVCLAQDGKENADFMRSNGRIYVVIAVIITILAGLIIYLVRLDKKISRLEKEK